MNAAAAEAFDHHEYDRSLKLYTRTCAVATRLNDTAGLASCSAGAGLAQSRLYHYDEALALFDRADALYQSLQDHAGVAGTLNNRGVILLHHGSDKEALATYERALTEAALSGDQVLVARTNLNLGNLYKETGKYSLAIQCFSKSLAITQSLHMDRQTAWLLNNLGTTYYEMHDMDMAQSYLEQALALKQKLGDQEDIGSTELNLGVMYQFLGNFPKALVYFDQALPRAEKLNNLALQCMLLYNIGDVQHQQHREAAAKENLKAALAMATKIANRSTAAYARIILGEIAVTEGHPEEGLSLAREALQYGDESGEPTCRIRANDVIGLAEQNLGKADLAEAAFREAIRVIEDLRDRLPGERQGISAFMSERPSYGYMVQNQLDQGRPDLALAYAERSKSRALLDVLQSGHADITHTMTEEERRQEAGLNTEIAHLRERMIEESHRPQPNRKAIADLTGQLEAARHALRAWQTALYAGHPQLKVQRVAFEPVAAADLVAALPDANTALLEYMVGETGTWLFAVTREGAGPNLRVYKIAGKDSPLREQAARFREQIAGRDLDYRPLAVSLYRTLIDPAREQLRGRTTLVIVPDGYLWQVPFQALEPTPEHYLLQDRAIFYAPSLSVLYEMGKLRKARRSPESRVLAMDAVVLPAARREVEGLRALYGDANVKIYTGPDADEDRFKQEAPHYQVVHLAAHGVFEDGNPMNSYLVLAKAGKAGAGILEARDMMDLDLHADLVVLSGCETGRGIAAGEGLIGMAWALFIAGSPATVASQWKVESGSTSDLMLEFHKHLQTAPKARALQQAALEVMKNREYRHPFYWSGFVLMGEGF